MALMTSSIIVVNEQYAQVGLSEETYTSFKAKTPYR